MRELGWDVGWRDGGCWGGWTRGPSRPPVFAAPHSPSPSTGYCGNLLGRKDAGASCQEGSGGSPDLPCRLSSLSLCLPLKPPPAFLLISLCFFLGCPSLGDAVPVKFHFFPSSSLCLSVSLCLYSFLSLLFFSMYVCMYVSLPSLSPSISHYLCLPHKLLLPLLPMPRSGHLGIIQRGPLAKVT